MCTSVDPLVSSAIAFKQATVSAKIQTAVAAKVLDQQRSDGAAAIKLLNAANLGVNRAGSTFASAATGLGSTVDVAA